MNDEHENICQEESVPVFDHGSLNMVKSPTYKYTASPEI
jgi:hypothetical protein